MAQTRRSSRKKKIKSEKYTTKDTLNNVRIKNEARKEMSAALFAARALSDRSNRMSPLSEDNISLINLSQEVRTSSPPPLPEAPPFTLKTPDEDDAQVYSSIQVERGTVRDRDIVWTTMSRSEIPSNLQLNPSMHLNSIEEESGLSDCELSEIEESSDIDGNSLLLDALPHPILDFSELQQIHTNVSEEKRQSISVKRCTGEKSNAKRKSVAHASNSRRKPATQTQDIGSKRCILPNCTSKTLNTARDALSHFRTARHRASISRLLLREDVKEYADMPVPEAREFEESKDAEDKTLGTINYPYHYNYHHNPSEYSLALAEWYWARYFGSEEHIIYIAWLTHRNFALEHATVFSNVEFKLEYVLEEMARDHNFVSSAGERTHFYKLQQDDQISIRRMDTVSEVLALSHLLGIAKKQTKYGQTIDV
ncbi:uncharacterized protein V1516DRAFT_145593 [Lipomyces oligophaga]|uniref:uncharacterized protein n=1 Tax=Lipomyces oligophaga TaxID=45792 RepID=UPI0034CF5C7A